MQIMSSQTKLDQINGHTLICANAVLCTLQVGLFDDFKVITNMWTCYPIIQAFVCYWSADCIALSSNLV